MKKVTAMLGLTCLILAGCTSNEITSEKAFQLVQQDQQYPKVIDYDLYCSDPQHARKTIEAGLDKAGVVIISQTQKISELGKPLIKFTPNAQPYLLETPEADKHLYIQKVKLADEELVEITSLKTQPDGKSAVAEYTTAYINLTPFATLQPTRFNRKPTNKAFFILEGNQWQLEKRK
ncbi:hypothetical protein [Adhaeribacter rhizoryzae]|uniref:Lipoprotein n=1 Tax=Adhaeribacter rhizoryzae TaxID=2607907 RepID=A0A5M6DPB3_9BACT|nr:hypothetical protein [Adhaeribacter rhizoryzae]KAA5548109.1 hypothetical protein F0145_05115 [Adhaeribacter rhizoryzae]